MDSSDLATALARPTTVVIAHDYPVVRLGLFSLLDGSGRFQVVGEATTASAPRAAAQAEPQLLVMGTSAATNSVGELVRQVVDHHAVRVVVLGTAELPDLVRGVIAAGAMAYIQWTASAEELLLACHHVVAGEPYVSPALAMRILQLPSTSSTVNLNDRERDMLTHLVAGETSRQMAAAMHLSIRTVDALRASVRHKLGTVDRASTVEAVNRLRLIR